MKPVESPFEIRDLKGIEEMVAAEHLQKQVWGCEDDFDNKDILTAIQHAGGLVAGAFNARGELVGFILAFPTLQPGVLHSHRLAVSPSWRRHGLGMSLKWFQRNWCLARGLERVQWTCDPLRTINAALNIYNLGAISNVYYENYYGTMKGINAGAPSDRILLDWHLNSPRVISCLRNERRDTGANTAVTANPCNGHAPGRELLDLDAPWIQIVLPQDFGSLLRTDPKLALQWRFHIRRLLEHYFSREYFISSFTMLGGPAYILEQGKKG